MPESSDQPQKSYSDFQVIIFIVILCVICAFLLAIAAFGLQEAQTQAKEFDQSKQMLIAAKILNHSGSFQIIEPDGALLNATFDPQTKIIIPFSKENAPQKAADNDIKAISSLRIRPLLTDEAGHVYTLEEKNLSLSEYLSENKKTGYANLPLKLFYAILPNSEESEKLSAKDIAKTIGKVEMVVIPISGFGLWAPIYGYIAIGSDGDKVIGATWYEHAETPGLGANITEPWWQKQFYGKKIFQKSLDGSTDFKTASLGIVVVKGKVSNVYGTSPKAQSAVDGMSGATLTGDGVTQGYHNSLTPYRNFLIKLREAHTEKQGEAHGEQASPS